MALKWIGGPNGETGITGVPARDLTDEEVSEVQEREGLGESALLASGLYVPTKAAKPAPIAEPETTKEAS